MPNLLGTAEGRGCWDNCLDIAAFADLTVLV